MSPAWPFAGLLPRSYGVILADPPWSFATWSAKGTGRGAVSHYDTLTFAELRALPVADLAAEDCALLLWTTDPQLPRALDLIDAWGFHHKTTAFTWCKPTLAGTGWAMGCGYWTRANPEMCLLATRGKPRRLSRSVPQLIVAPRREHSRKPEEAGERIEHLIAGPYAELFARDSRPGWDAWGAEAGLFDHGPVRTRRQPSNGPDPPLGPQREPAPAVPGASNLREATTSRKRGAVLLPHTVSAAPALKEAAE